MPLLRVRWAAGTRPVKTGDAKRLIAPTPTCLMSECAKRALGGAKARARPLERPGVLGKRDRRWRR